MIWRNRLFVVVPLVAATLTFVLLRSDHVQHAKVPILAEPSAALKSNSDDEYRAFHPFGASETLGNEKLNRLAVVNDPWIISYLKTAILDERHTSRWRNYCVQHAAQHYLLHRDSDSQQLLRLALTSKDENVLDVAIFSFARIICDAKVSTSDVFYAETQTILKGTLYKDRPSKIKLSGLRGIALTQDASFIDDIFNLAFNNGEEVMVRVAAVDTLGGLNATAYRNQLKILQEDKSILLSASAKRTYLRLSRSSVLSSDSKLNAIDDYRSALQSTSREDRTQAIRILFNATPVAMELIPEIGKAVALLDEDSEESEIAVHLELIRKMGRRASGVSGVILSLLDERSRIYRGKSKSAVHQIRAYCLLVISDIGRSEDALSYIADALVNSDREMQYTFAAGAYAVSSLSEKGRPFIPYLAKALRLGYPDKVVALDRYRAMPSTRNRTSARLEAIRALLKVGNVSTEVLILLAELSTSSNNLIPGVPEEAKLAIAALRTNR